MNISCLIFELKSSSLVDPGGAVREAGGGGGVAGQAAGVEGGGGFQLYHAIS